jgi:hypothetical protein
MRRNICGSNQRTGKGSIEVYPIKDYGAEIGLHQQSGTSRNALRSKKFIIMWQHKNTEWRITKVISSLITNKSCLHKDNNSFISVYFSYKPKSSPELIIWGPIAAINFSLVLEATVPI